jgi:formylmethanofuran dehydrogenase subunit E-like metal-binding protein
MEGEVLYKITDNLLIYRDRDGKDKLVYLIDPPKEKYMQILNMREVENNVNEAVQKYIEFLSEDNKENLSKIELFAFLLKVRLYIKYISRNLLVHMLFDEYEQLEEDISPAFTIAEYLLNKEPLSKENKSILLKELIIGNTELFNKLYSSIKDVTFKMTKFNIKHIYLNFYLTLRANQ